MDILKKGLKHLILFLTCTALVLVLMPLNEGIAFANVTSEPLVPLKSEITAESLAKGQITVTVNSDRYGSKIIFYPLLSEKKETPEKCNGDTYVLHIQTNKVGHAYTVEDLKPCTTYYLYVCAVDWTPGASGHKIFSDWSEPITIKTQGNAFGKVALAKSSYAYDGKVKTPTVTVKNDKGVTLKKNTHYTVRYASGRKQIGTYKVTIKGKGDYTETVTKTFKINPPKVSVLTPTAGKGKVTVKWKKVAGGVKYQVAFMVKGSTSYKYVTAKNTSKTIKKLKSGKSCSIKVRAFKTINGTKYYGAWSAKKSVKIR